MSHASRVTYQIWQMELYIRYDRVTWRHDSWLLAYVSLACLCAWRHAVISVCVVWCISAWHNSSICVMCTQSMCAMYMSVLPVCNTSQPYVKYEYDTLECSHNSIIYVMCTSSICIMIMSVLPVCSTSQPYVQYEYDTLECSHGYSYVFYVSHPYVSWFCLSSLCVIHRSHMRSTSMIPYNVHVSIRMYYM